MAKATDSKSILENKSVGMYWNDGSEWRLCDEKSKRRIKTAMERKLRYMYVNPFNLGGHRYIFDVKLLRLKCLTTGSVSEVKMIENEMSQPNPATVSKNETETSETNFSETNSSGTNTSIVQHVSMVNEEAKILIENDNVKTEERIQSDAVAFKNASLKISSLESSANSANENAVKNSSEKTNSNELKTVENGPNSQCLTNLKVFFKTEFSYLEAMLIDYICESTLKIHVEAKLNSGYRLLALRMNPWASVESAILSRFLNTLNQVFHVKDARLELAFHGTPLKNVESILQNGLDSKYRLTGSGEYMTTDPSYSRIFTEFIDTDFSFKLIVCLVLLGTEDVSVHSRSFIMTNSAYHLPIAEITVQ